MFEIVRKEKLATHIFLMDIHAPRVAQKANPGQFIMIRLDENGERIPLTICDYVREKGLITIVFQTVGYTTGRLAQYICGNFVLDVVGPLGNPSELVHTDLTELKQKKILFIAGGVGIAPIYPQAKWLFENGIDADAIIGCKSKEYLFFEENLKAVTANLYVTTDDGSYGYQGLVTDLLTDQIAKDNKRYDHIVAIGPMIMMKNVAAFTKEYGIRTIVSLNPIMVDGTGMCGGCRVAVNHEMRFACVDGPEFDGHQVNFDAAIRRLKCYQDEEAIKLKQLTNGR